MTRTVLLGDICDVRDGTHDSPKPKASGHPLVTSKHIKNYRIDFSTANLISNEDFEAVNRRSKVDKHDILISMIGTVGELALIDYEPSFAIKNIGLIKTGDELLGKYLFYYLQSTKAKQYIEASLAGSTQKFIGLGQLRKFPIDLPDLETQKKIADILGTIDEKIELNRQMNGTLEQMGQALFRHYFIDNPETEKWEEVKIGEFIESALGGDWGKEKPDERHTRQVYVIRGTDMDGVKNGNVANVPLRFVDEKKYLTRQLRVGDVLIEISGGSNTQSTGRSLYIDQSTLDLLGGSVIPASFCRVIRARSLKKASVLFTFLEYLYDIGAMWDYQNRSTGISNFQYKFFIDNARIRNVSDDIEEDFYGKIQPLIAQRAQNAQQIQILTTLRDTLLPRLISGKVKIDGKNSI